jgi:hypothetical protein
MRRSVLPKEQTVKRTPTQQMVLPLVTEDLSNHLDAAALAHAVELLKQMLIAVARADPLPKETDHEREDPTRPS